MTSSIILNKEHLPQKPSLPIKERMTPPPYNIPDNIVQKYKLKDIENAWYLHEQTSSREPNHEELSNPLAKPHVDTNEKTPFSEHRYIVEGSPFKKNGDTKLYRAWDTHLERIVLVKSSIARNPTDSVIELEALTLAKISHPNIPEVYSFIRGAITHDGREDCLVMQYIEGPTVTEIYQENKKQGHSPKLSMVVDIVDKTASALSYLFTRHNIKHRDPKPENIILDEKTGSFFLIDLDISSWVRNGPKGRDGILGSPQYMAPEILLHKPTHANAESTHSLATVAYELLTGRQPYGTNKSEYLLAEMEADKLSAWKTLRKFFPTNVMQTLDEVFTKGLVNNPEHRYPDPRLFAAALKHAIFGNHQVKDDATIPYEK